MAARQDRDLAAISPTGTGKTLSYLLPVMSALGAPASSAKSEPAAGVRALIVAPTRELAHQIHNECLKLAQGRKWRIVLFSKATASTLVDKAARDRVGECRSVQGFRAGSLITTDVIIATPLRLVASLQNGSLELDKYVESDLTQGARLLNVSVFASVRHLILDEADRLLDREFFAQVQEITAACTHESVQKAVFSATLPAGVEKIAMDMLRDPIRVVVGLK
jgi:ATP-dependent RNA helicase DDX52/ROK1